MNKNSVCYVTSYLDIGRDRWNSFSRSFDTYLEHFSPFIELFQKTNCENDEMIVFIDENYKEKLETFLNKYGESNIKLISLNNEILLQLYSWNTLEKETNIMNSDYFKTLVKDRLHFPECKYPKYTLINHCKIDFVCFVIDNNLSDKNIFSWVDFGFFNDKNNIPNKLLDTSNFDLSKINYHLINPIEYYDNNIYYQLQFAPEKIGGFFFIGYDSTIKNYQKIYHDTLDLFQDELKIADDDQSLILYIYFKYPELFSFNKENFGWHKVLIYNQKK